jgi:hypothetical protein
VRTRLEEVADEAGLSPRELREWLKEEIERRFVVAKVRALRKDRAAS